LSALRAVVPALLLLVLACEGRAAVPAEPVFEDGRLAMGTVFEVQLVGLEVEVARSVSRELFDEVQRLEELLSGFDPRSEVSRLNASAGLGVAHLPSPELAEVLGLALSHGRTSRGAFDVTVGPVVALWRDAARRSRLPTAAERNRVLALVGRAAIETTADGALRLPRAGSSIDLGGIAKGYALDRLRSTLASHDVAAALLNFGQSSVWAVGAPPGGSGWNLLLRTPEGAGDGPGHAGVITLRDQALSVSSSLGQWSEIGGHRYGHVVDPRSGLALDATSEAAVIAPSASLAEVLSTALLVLKPSEGMAVVESLPGVEALWIGSGGERFESSGWQQATAFRPL